MVFLSQAPGAHAAGKPLVTAQASEVRFVGIERFVEEIEDSEGPNDAQEILQADPAVALLEANQSTPRHPRPVGELDLGEAAQTSPGR
jgi:hypothetical protein